MECSASGVRSWLKLLRVWLCWDANGRTHLSRQFPKAQKLHGQTSNYVFLNTENHLCFIFLLLSANCSVTVQTSVTFISLLETASIYLLAEQDMLWPLKGAQLILNLIALGQRRISSWQSLWYIVSTWLYFCEFTDYFCFDCRGK